MKDSLKAPNDIQAQVDYWQKLSALEEGRNQVLKMVATGEPLQDVLNTLCQKAQIYNPELFCSILLFNDSDNTLHPIASFSLPDFYCQALDGVVAGLGVGSCGTSAFTKKRVIVEDINTHPYWAQYKGLALQAGLQACWSEPIIGIHGKVFGTFAIYYGEPKAPDEEDLKFIELSANLAAVVFENDLTRTRLLEANNQLNLTIDERNLELAAANKELELLIQTREESYVNSLNSEKSMTTNALLCGFAHEISTPIGTAKMAISTVREKMAILSEKFSEGSLSKKVFQQYLTDVSQLVKLNQEGLDKAESLLNQFKSVDSQLVNNPVESIDLAAFIYEVKNSVSGVLGSHQLSIDVEPNINIKVIKESLWQVLYQLIENSVIHGFKTVDCGTIQITAMVKDNSLYIDYQDDGVGLDEEGQQKLFDPFYTKKRAKKNLGLGLTMVVNLLNNVLHGKISLMPSPLGVRYEIVLPAST